MELRKSPSELIDSNPLVSASIVNIIPVYDKTVVKSCGSHRLTEADYAEKSSTDNMTDIPTICIQQ